MKELHPLLADICKETDTRPEAIQTLLKYYTKSCGWTEESAVEYVYELIENGVIDQIKLIK